MAIIERGQKEGQMFELRIYTCSMLHLRDNPWPKVLVIEHILYPFKKGSNIWWGKHVSFSNERDFWTDRNEGCGILAVIEWKPTDIQSVFQGPKQSIHPDVTLVSGDYAAQRRVTDMLWLNRHKNTKETYESICAYVLFP